MNKVLERIEEQKDKKIKRRSNKPILHFCIDKEIKQLLKEAAKLRNQTMTALVVYILKRECTIIINEERKRSVMLDSILDSTRDIL